MQHAAVPAKLNKHGDEHAAANQVQMQRGFEEVTVAEGLPYGSPLAYQGAAPYGGELNLDMGASAIAHAAPFRNKNHARGCCYKKKSKRTCGEIK